MQSPPPSSAIQSSPNKSFENTTQTQISEHGGKETDGSQRTRKKSRRAGRKRPANTNSSNAIDIMDKNNNSVESQNVWFKKNIENVKKSTPTKPPPRFDNVKPKDVTTNSSTSTLPMSSPKTEANSNIPMTSTPRYADILKAPPPKVNQSRCCNLIKLCSQKPKIPPPAAPKAIAKLPSKETTSISSAKAQQPKRSKREPILLGDIVIKEV